ncbi:hypothetical protein EDD11_002268 [Mortierella claussenii]|nr:hypothetical protein EDD11_002268 [Mortierella claussenii]
MASAEARISARQQPIPAALAPTPALVQSSTLIVHHDTPTAFTASFGNSGTSSTRHPYADLSHPALPSTAPGITSATSPSEGMEPAPAVLETNPLAGVTKQPAKRSVSRAESSSAKRHKMSHLSNQHSKQRASTTTSTFDFPSSTPPEQQIPIPRSDGVEGSLSPVEEQGRREEEEEEEEEEKEAEEEEDSSQPQFLGQRATNPMELHEIRVNVARFLARRELRSCLLVSASWWDSFAPFLWHDLRPVYCNILGGTNNYPSGKQIQKNGHLIRAFEYNGHGDVLLAMIPSTGTANNTNVDDELQWRKTEEEKKEEAGWVYVDEDIGSDESADPDESLSEFEARLEANRVARERRMVQMQDVREANRRQNETSHFLNDGTNYRRRVCNQIKKLIFTDKRVSRDRGCHFWNWLTLVQINQDHLYCLELHFAIRWFEAYRDIFNQILILEKLTELTLIDNDLDTVKIKPFLETVCVRLSKLELRNVRVDYGVFPGQHDQNTAEHQIMPMENMRSLTLVKIQARNSNFTMLFLKQCPNLIELFFHPQSAQPVKEFREVITEKLSKMTHLSFQTSNMSDTEVASIIKAVPVLQKLDFSNSGFGLMATNNLSTRHHCTITHLNIRTCARVTASMIQRILGECRSLRTFQADHVRAKDMLNNSVYPTWTCLGLRELMLDFRGDANDTETSLKIYKQLAQLVCLQELDLSRRPSSNKLNKGVKYSNCLSLGLQSGLRELRTLVNMQRLIYRGAVNNEVGVIELLWMAKAWPQLSEIGGKLRERKSTKFNVNVHPKEVYRKNWLVETPGDGRSGTFGGIESAAAMATDTTSTTATVTPSSGPSYLLTSVPSTTPVRSPAAAATAAVAATTATAAITANSTGALANNHPLPGPCRRVKREAPPNLMAIELRRLKLNHRIKVIPHIEDNISIDQRRRNKYLLGLSSDEEQDRSRYNNGDARYRHF